MSTSDNAAGNTLVLKVLDKWGSPETYPQPASGWAVAFDAPFGWMKQVASDFGGTRNGMVVSWPMRISARGEIPTLLSRSPGDQGAYSGERKGDAGSPAAL